MIVLCVFNKEEISVTSNSSNVGVRQRHNWNHVNNSEKSISVQYSKWIRYKTKHNKTRKKFGKRLDPKVNFLCTVRWVDHWDHQNNSVCLFDSLGTIGSSWTLCGWTYIDGGGSLLKHKGYPTIYLSHGLTIQLSQTKWNGSGILFSKGKFIYTGHGL